MEAGEEGVVLRRLPGNRVAVAVERSSACAQCHARQVCVPGERDTMVIEAEDSLETAPGDRVRVGTSRPAGSAAALRAYGIPLCGLLAGAFLAWMMAPAGLDRDARDLLAAVAALAGVAAGFLALRLLERRYRSQGGRFRIRVLEVVSRSGMAAPSNRMP